MTQIWDYRIFIINPKTYEITGYIECPDMDMESGSTEQMVQYGKYVYVNCWSYQNRILKIDTETDKVVDELTIGIQPTSLVMDKYNKMWTITDGGYEGSPYGYEAPSLYRIDAETFTVEKQFKFKLGDWPSEVQLNGTRDTLYWIGECRWKPTVFPSGLFWSFGTPNTTALRSIPTTGRYMWPTLLITSNKVSCIAIRRKAS